MTPIIYKLTDNVLIKGNSSSNSPQTVSVQTIVNYAIAQGYGNAFMLIDGGSSFSGSAIRFFTISGNTAYLGSTDFLSLNPYKIGISDGTSTNSNITSTTNVGYCYNGSSFNAMSVAYNWVNYTKNNILYYTQGGNTSANYGYQTGYYLPDTVTNVYIDEEPVLTYTWSPVPSINGKLGNIDLSKILTINDGEPKSGTSSDVKLTTISLVKTLINRIVVDEDEVAVEYQVVDDNFEYIKLVYKQDSEPISVDDGTAIDLDPDESIIGISGICDGNVYYFKIFTNINESEAYEFRTAVIKPRDTIIELLKNGTLLNSDSLVPDPYVSASELDTATSALTANGYEIIVKANQSTSWTRSFHTTLTENNTPTTTGRTYKPLVITNSQDARFSFYDYFKIKFDMQVTIQPSDSGFAIEPRIYGNNGGIYLMIAAGYQDTYIRSDPNNTVTVNLKDIETNWREYLDYVGSSTEQPSLTFAMNFSNGKYGIFDFKLIIKEIQVKLNELFLPQCIPDVYLGIKKAGTTSSQSWKIKELYQAVVALGYNSFLLQPNGSTGGSTYYYVIPFNLTYKDNLYIARDYYLKDASGYAAFGIETTDNLSGLPIYDANGDSQYKALVKREGSTTSFPNTTTKDGHTYTWRQITSVNSRQGFVFYTDACKKLHINNKVVL